MAKEAAAVEQQPNAGVSKLVVILVGLVAMLFGTGITLALFLTGLVPVGGLASLVAPPLDSDRPPPPRIYMPMDPPFVVNFERAGRRGFLQVTMQAMARDPKLVAELEKHNPVIRNNLLLLLATKSPADVDTRAGREALRQEALAEINAVLEQMGVEGSLEELYFTGFVMQ